MVRSLLPPDLVEGLDVSKIRYLEIIELQDIPAIMTPNQAEQHDMIYPKPPVPEICEYCGTQLPYLGRRSLDKNMILSWDKPVLCGCEKAVTHRERDVREQELLRIQDDDLRRKEEQRKKINRLFEQSRMGERFKVRTFDTYKVNNKNRSAYETSLKYADNFQDYKSKGIGLIYTGQNGTGKTHLAAAITNKLIHQGTPVVFGTLITLLDKIKQSYTGDADESKILHLYSTVDLLVIDDLGKERTTEWVLEKLYHVVNERYEKNLPIVITTNYDANSLIQRLSLKGDPGTSQAVVSRLYEICRGEEFSWEDYRMSGVI